MRKSAGKPTTLFLLFLFLSFPAHADDPKVLGEGKELCRTWTDARASSNADSHVLEAWINGFVTAHLAKRDFGTQDLPGWFDQFCKANPHVSIDTAVEGYIRLYEPDPDHPLYL